MYSFYSHLWIINLSFQKSFKNFESLRILIYIFILLDSSRFLNTINAIITNISIYPKKYLYIGVLKMSKI